MEGLSLQATAEQLAVIFGLQRIKDWAEEFSLDPASNEGQHNLSLQQTEAILDSLYATAGDVTKPDDFVKLLVLYICVSIFFPNLSGSTNRFWFAEVTHCISKNKGVLGKCKPRFARWNARKLAEKIGNDGVPSLKQDLTGSFVDPLDEDEQSLMTPIKIRQATSDRIGEKRVRDGDRDEDWDLSPDIDSDEGSDKDWELSPDIDLDGESDEDWELSPDRDAARHLEDLAPVYPFKKRKTYDTLPRLITYS
ncbi:hypothetical protein MKX03_005070 [Papaver bracteatum]|nr:hypothetical protein MKX03_005070 [Papaver bracteatum]